MMILLKILFWLSFVLAMTPYGLYPLAVWVIWLLRRQPPRRSAIEPSITIIVPARNEQAVIARRIDNLLQLDYPREKTQILIISDASTDATNAIAEDYAARGAVEFLLLAERRGKTGAQNEALRRATGEVVVFSDASTIMRRDALRKIVRSLADPQVGCVGGWITLTSTGDFSGRRRLSAYLHFEQMLRKMEGEIWTTSGLNGCFYAIRRELLQEPMNERAQIDDLYSGLRVMESGNRVVYEPDALCAEAIEIESSAGFRRRVRSSLGGMSTLFSMSQLLNPFRHPVMALQLLLHRLSRFFLVPLLLFCAITNFFLVASGRIYLDLFVLQCLAWLGVLLGAFSGRFGPFPKCGIFHTLYAFMQQHAASLIAVGKFAHGHDHAARWETTPPPRQ